MLDGVIQRITYVNDENGYTVARLKVPRQKQLVTIAGHLPGLGPGEGLRVEGEWVNHASYGRQFVVHRYQTAAPGSVGALKRYLGSGLLKGVGPVVAEHLVNTFGLDTLKVLDEEPERLAEVPGMGRKKAGVIAQAWAERRALKDLMLFLQNEGLPVLLAVRILKKYGSASEEMVRRQPYSLAGDVYGVTFDVADALGVGLGFAQDALPRIAAGMAHVLREAGERGHSYLSLNHLTASAARSLALPQADVAAALVEVVASGAVDLVPLGLGSDGVAEKVAYLPLLNQTEQSCISSLTRLKNAPSDRLQRFARIDWQTTWAKLDKPGTLTLTQEQRGAIQAALTEKIAVVTGGPGTGKTTTLRSIVALVSKYGGRVALAAPTGRAAKRLSEATGVAASTIHRLLELRPGGTYEVKSPLDADLVVIDEASMMDLVLADALLRSVPTGAHLLLVGDADQLPPVGPGAVFRDVILSRSLTTVTLSTVFRQPQGSAIVSNAHRMNTGEMPHIGPGVEDFFFLREPDAARCARLVVDLVGRRLPTHYALDPLDDIQVLAPVYSGLCGIDALNSHLQAALNPPTPTKDERRFGSRIFRVGDKVMQVVNDYDRQVSNGELGRIVRIDSEEETIHISFDSEWTVSYNFAELDELTHAYAISVHKAQGSEYPVVVMPVLPQHGRLLQRNVLYTAVSRARRLVVLAGSSDALRRGIANEDVSQRNSGLVPRLRTALLT